MKIKNISPIERHVEKLVFAVAAAASLYLVYSSLTSPTTVDDKVATGGGPVGASEVESKVADAIKKLQQAQTNTREKALPTIKITGEDFVHRYQLSQSEPLSPDLLKPIAACMPRQYEPKGTPGTPGGDTRTVDVRVPIVPAPNNLTLSADRKVVVVPVRAARDPNTPVNPNEPVPTENRDMSWVLVEAKYPMAELMKAVQSANLPRPAQRVTFLTVQAQRMDLTANGKWEDVAPTSAVQIPLIDFAAIPDEKMLDVLNWYDQRIEDILTPKFFDPAAIAPTTPTVPAARPAAPTPPPTMPPEFAGGGEMPPEEGPGGPGGPGRTGRLGGSRSTRSTPPALTRRPPTPAPTPARPPVPTPTPGGPGTPPGFMPPEGMPMEPGMMPPAAAAQAAVDLRAQQQVTIKFYDEHVQPDHEYAYRLRVGIFNPTYRLQAQLKDDPKAVERPILFSPWAEAHEIDGGKLASVKIDPNMFLFVSKPITSSGETAQISIYKWDSGAWQKSDETVVPGQQIGHKRLVAGSKEVDFTTDYTLVDVHQDSGNILAIFQGSNGLLTVRSGTADSSNPKRQDLEKQIAPKPAPKPATPGA